MSFFSIYKVLHLQCEFTIDKLIQKINGEHTSEFISEKSNTLFVLLLTDKNGESCFVKAASKINDVTNEVLAIASKETNILGYKISGKIFFEDVPQTVQYFSDMWLLEFFFISYFY